MYILVKARQESAKETIVERGALYQTFEGYRPAWVA